MGKVSDARPGEAIPDDAAVRLVRLQSLARAAGRRPRLALALACVLLAAGAVVILAGGGGGSASKPKAKVVRAKPPPVEPGSFDLKSHPKVVQLQGAGSQPKPNGSTRDTGPSPGAQSDAQVRAELKQARKSLRSFKHYLTTSAFLETGPRARVARDGSAVAPDNAPDVIQRVMLAGNEIAKFPYKWGGGHGAWRDNGYDCSGSVSFALAGAGLLNRPLTSGAFMNWGAEGPGKWITIFASPGHIFMYVAGLRFDTSGRGRAGTRWQDAARSTAGFAVRHIPGL
jgi:cell wall-associated NlpC family hydrolase